MDLKNYLMRRISRLDKKLSITKDAIVYKDSRDTYISESCTLVKLPDIIQKVHYLLDGENIIITSELEEGIPDEYFIVSNEFRKEDFKTIRCLEKTIVTPMHPLYKFVMKAALEAALFEAEDRRACTQEIDADELLAEYEEMNATRQHDFEEAAMELESTKIEVLKQKEWIVNKLKQGGAMEYTTVVSASASEMAPVQYIAPYAGCAIAEEWLEQGKDVLIVYDDLSKHAVAYRTLSLLLKRAPGREAYPGDVFYLHSRLLERSCRLNEENGGGSITALPIIETQAGDISAYIPTNVISITDGQIFLQQELFNAGFRPAIDTGLSVSRVGSAAQIKAMKQVSSSLKFELAQYQEMQAFAQFGSDLDEATKATIDHGEKVREVLKQAQYSPRSVTEQVITLFALKYGFTKTIKTNKISEFMTGITENVKMTHPEYLTEIEEKKVLSDELISSLKEVMSAYVKQFENLQKAE